MGSWAVVCVEGKIPSRDRQGWSGLTVPWDHDARGKVKCHEILSLTRILVWKCLGQASQPLSIIVHVLGADTTFFAEQPGLKNDHLSSKSIDLVRD